MAELCVKSIHELSIFQMPTWPGRRIMWCLACTPLTFNCVWIWCWLQCLYLFQGHFNNWCFVYTIRQITVVWFVTRLYSECLVFHVMPDNKVHGANMGPTWVLSAPDGPHVGPMNIAIRDPFIMLSPQCQWGDLEWNEKDLTYPTKNKPHQTCAAWNMLWIHLGYILCLD